MLSVSLSLNGPQTITPGATINVSSDFARSQSEMSLVVNPTNPLNVVGFSHRLNAPITMHVYSSADGGLNWSVSEIDNADDGLGTVGNRFDPTLQFDASGRLYIAYGYRGQAVAPLRDTLLVVASSTDGGLTFGNYLTVDTQPDILTANPNDTDTPGLDKWYLATGRDPASGNQAVFLAYNAFVLEGANTDARVSIIGSRDGGINWTPRLVINDDSAVADADSAGYASPIVDNLGRLAVSWHDFDDTSIMIDRDTDGLWSNVATFGNDVTVRTGIDVEKSIDLPPAQPQRGVNAAPMLEVWRALGILYIPVVERFNGADLDIWVGRSTDFGATWIFDRIDDSAGTEFNPWLQVDQTSGTVNVLYYTTAGDVGTGNDDVRPRLATSNDGGVTWTHGFLSTQTSNESGGGMGNYGGDYLEYIGLGVRDGTAHGLWASRYPDGGTDLDAFTANAAFVSGTGDNRLYIGESGGADDNYLIRQSPTNPAFLEVFVDGVREFTGLSATLDKIIINPGGGTNTFEIGTLTGISSVTINGTNNVDTYDIVSLGLGAPLGIVLGGGDDTVFLGSSPFAGQLILSPVTVFGEGGNDTLYLGSNNGDSIDANVAFDGGEHVGPVGDRIVFNDTAPSYNLTYDIAGTFVIRDGINLPHTVGYSFVEGIVINAGSGADTVTVRNGVTVDVTANGNGANDTFIIGGGNVGLSNSTAVLSGGPGNDTLVLDDSLYAGAADWAIDDTQVQRNAPGQVQLFGYASFEGIGIKTGIGGASGNNIYAFGAIPVSVTVTGGAGTDNFFLNNFANEAAGGPIGSEQLQSTFDGGGGFNALIVDDFARGFLTYDMYPNRLVINEVLADDGDFFFANIGAMSVSASDSQTTLNVYGTPASILPGNQTTVFLRGGNDFVNVYPHDAMGNLTVTTNIGIVGESGSDTLTVQDAASAEAINYSFSNPFGASTQNIFGMGTGALGTATIENLVVNAGAGPDTFDVNQYASGTALTLNAGDGDDVCNFGDGDVAANVTSIASFLFNGMEGTDTFNLRNTNPASSFTYTAAGNTTLQISRTFPSSYFVSLEYYNTEQKVVYAGPAADIMNITSFASGELSFHGAGGDDALNLPTSSDFLGRRVNFFGDAGAANRINQVTNSKTAPSTLHVAQSTIGAFSGDDFFAPGGSVFFDSVQIIQLRMGSGADTAYMQPDAVAAISIIGGNPTTAPGDTLNLSLALAANYVINGSPASGSVTSDNLQTLTYSGFETGPTVDDAAPYILAQGYDDSGLVPTIFVQFSEDVSAVLSVAYLELINTTTTEQIAFGLMAMNYDGGANTASFTFPGYTDGKLPPGDYTAKIYGTLIDLYGNPMGTETPFGFTVASQFLDADVNMDGLVDIFDVNLVSEYWGTAGPTGDANHDGVVDIFDVNLISASWGQFPPAAGGGVASADGNTGGAESSLRSQPSAVIEPIEYASTSATERAAPSVGSIWPASLPTSDSRVARRHNRWGALARATDEVFAHDVDSLSDRVGAALASYWGGARGS